MAIQGVRDGGLPRGERLAAADWHLFMLHVSPEPFDSVQFGAVGREVKEMDPDALQIHQRRLDHSAAMHGVVNRGRSRTAALRGDRTGKP
jgi:hypothetical protein